MTVVKKKIVQTVVDGVEIVPNGEVLETHVTMNGKYSLQRAQAVIRKENNSFSAIRATQVVKTYAMPLEKFIENAEIIDVTED